MVKTVQAYAASDGKVFVSYEEAIAHDARIALKAINIFNEASILAVIEHADAIVTAIKAVAEEQRPTKEKTNA